VVLAKEEILLQSMVVRLLKLEKGMERKWMWSHPQYRLW